MTSRELSCAACAAVTPFEQPPCRDDHDECSEWLCTRCGEAVLVAPLTVAPLTVTPLTGAPLIAAAVNPTHGDRGQGTAIATRQRRAA